MEKRIQLEKRGRDANLIVELNLDNCRSTTIQGLTDEFTALESLSLINVGLTSLKNFPKLPSLRKLELSDNRISNGLDFLVTSPKLTHLNLSGNKIKDLETLKPLENFQNLTVLDLFNNEATSVENYREKIFAMIPSLKYLDGFDANEVEASSEGDDDDEVNGNESDDDVSDELDDDNDGEDIEDDEDAGDNLDEEEDDDDDSEDNGDISLAEVYNDDIEEDNSDWGEEDEVEDDDEDDSDEEGDEAAVKKNAEVPEESQARGKKRKHDG